MATYKFYEEPKNKRVICRSRFAGKIVSASATCCPEDTYSFEKGADLASARVDVKVADKRLKRASQKVDEARQRLNDAMDYLARMEEYLNDAIQLKHDALDELERIESEL